MMKILVTGCAGFIGSHTCEALLARGHKLVGIDNLQTGNILNMDNLRHFDFELVVGDINDEERLDLAFSEKIDAVLHLAAQNSVPKSFIKSSKCYENNVSATQKVLQKMRENDIKKIVFSSSSSVQSGPKRSYYASSKAICETLIKDYSSLTDIKHTILRYFNVFGPRQVANTYFAPLISKWIHLARQGKPIEIYGDGTIERDFTYIDNVVHANILALENDAKNDIYDIGCGYPVQIMRVAEIISRKYNVQFSYVKPRDCDILKSKADIYKAKLDLGYEPKTTFEQGMEEMLNGY